jgi:RimJ/RimL family protein N-acetyltransferase
MNPIKLIRILDDGAVQAGQMEWTDRARQAAELTVRFYSQTSYSPPWTDYFAVVGTRPVGVCRFNSPPVGGRVEIACFTFPEHEGQGFGTAMANELVRLTREVDRGLRVTARTKQPRDASHRVLEKVGFQSMTRVEHPQEGTLLVWERLTIG